MDGMTATEKILSAHCGRDPVRPGELVNAKLDLVVMHDVTSVPALEMLKRWGFERVFDPDRVVITPDHFVPNKDILAANNARALRVFAGEQGISRYYELGRHGICHALVPEEGFVLPGMTVVNADSHTTTLGAFGCFAAGIGSTDLAAALATGELWFRVPETMRFCLEGELPSGVYAKDVILYIISRIGDDGARYRVMEYAGSALASLSMEARMTICNMAAEAGAKTAVMPPDEVTFEYLRERTDAHYTPVSSDPDAHFAADITIDLGRLEPVVAVPNLPSNGRFVGEVAGTPVDQVYIGSCTNARIEDLRVAADIMRGRRVAPGVRVLVVPATTAVWKAAMREGLFEVFSEAGCVVSTATCGACLGGFMGVLGDGERCLSTTNRNFTGRMGSPQAQIYLASPATAAATALAGVITDPREMLSAASPP